MKWLSFWYWQYLFTDCTGWDNFWCRIKNHPRGVVWYSSDYEPDMHCKDCGELLG